MTYPVKQETCHIFPTNWSLTDRVLQSKLRCGKSLLRKVNQKWYGIAVLLGHGTDSKLVRPKCLDAPIGIRQ
jgi:hypothetical protein